MVCICGNLVNLRPHSGVGWGNTQADQREPVGFGVVTLGSEYLRTVTLPTSHRVAVAVLVLLGRLGTGVITGVTTFRYSGQDRILYSADLGPVARAWYERASAL